MKVILTQDVNKLGMKGDMVEVSDGYATNFLFRKGLAVEGTPGRLKEWQEQQKSKKNREAKMEKEAVELKKKIGGKMVTVSMSAGDEGKLFGSVTAAQVASAISGQYGVDVDKKDIKLADAIKQLGTHQFKIKLYTGVEVEMTLVVKAE